MDVLIILLKFIFVLFIAGFIVNKYVNIKSDKIKNIIKLVLIIIVIILFIVLIVYFTYFFNVIFILRSV